MPVMHTYAHPIPFIKKTKHLILLYFLMTGEMQKRKAEIYAQFFFGAPFGLSLLSFLVPEVSHHCFVLKLQRIGATEVKRMRIMINIPLLGPLGAGRGMFVLGEWMSYPLSQLEVCKKNMKNQPSSRFDQNCWYRLGNVYLCWNHELTNTKNIYELSWIGPDSCRFHCQCRLGI